MMRNLPNRPACGTIRRVELSVAESSHGFPKVCRSNGHFLNQSGAFFGVELLDSLKFSDWKSQVRFHACKFSFELFVLPRHNLTSSYRDVHCHNSKKYEATKPIV